MEIANSKQKQKTTKTDFCNGSTGSLKSSKKGFSGYDAITSDFSNYIRLPNMWIEF